MQMLMCRRQIWARRGVVLRMILFAPTALASPKPTTATISTIAATLPTNSTASVRLFVDLENLVASCIKISRGPHSPLDDLLISSPRKKMKEKREKWLEQSTPLDCNLNNYSNISIYKCCRESRDYPNNKVFHIEDKYIYFYFYYYTIYYFCLSYTNYSTTGLLLIII